jgi:hypothetical protein
MPSLPSRDVGTDDQAQRLVRDPMLGTWYGKLQFRLSDGVAARLRLSKAFAIRLVIFDDAFIGLQKRGSAIVAGTNRRVRFPGATSVTVTPGESDLSSTFSARR